MRSLNIRSLVLRRYDWWLILATYALGAVGFAAIYSIDLSRGNVLVYFPTQLLALAIATAVFFVMSNLHVTLYQTTGKFAYLFAIGLLIAVLFLGQNIRGTTGWFRFGSFSFQPVEFAKVAWILFLGAFIHHQGRRCDRLRFVLGGMMFLLPLVFLVMLQPDLGSAMIMAGIWFFLLFFTGVKKRYIFALVAAATIFFIVGWAFFFKEYQRDRLRTFVDPSRDRLGAGYNVSQSIIAIGSGQFFGRGLGFGSQSQLHFLPEAQTDFIFSVIAEELGFVGVALVFILYAVLLWRLSVIAARADTDFGSYTVVGIILLFLIHIILNIGATTGLLPVTGIPLPFLSYGGSALIMNFALMGVAESIARAGTKTRNMPLP